MTNKDYVLDSLINDDEAFTQIVEYFRFVEVEISVNELKILLNEMEKEGLIVVNKSWQNEHYEYPYSLTEKGRKMWEKLDFEAE